MAGGTDAEGCPCCGGPVKAGLLMCGGCWRRVPRQLAREVDAAHRDWKRTTRRRPFEREAERRAGLSLRTSQEAAIAAVTQQMEGAST